MRKRNLSSLTREGVPLIADFNEVDRVQSLRSIAYSKQHAQTHLLYVPIDLFSPDAAFLFYRKLFSDPKVTKQFRHGNAWSDDEIRKWILDCQTDWKQNGFGTCVVFKETAEGPQFVGTQNVYRREAGIEVGYAYLGSEQEKGLGKNGAHVIGGFLSSLIISKKIPWNVEIFATADPENARSIALLTKHYGMNKCGPTEINATYGKLRTPFSAPLRAYVLQQRSHNIASLFAPGRSSSNAGSPLAVNMQSRMQL